MCGPRAWFPWIALSGRRSRRCARRRGQHIHGFPAVGAGRRVGGCTCHIPVIKLSHVHEAAELMTGWRASAQMRTEALNDHTVKAFSEQLEGLSASIAQMGGLAEAQFAAAVDAIARRDTVLAENAVGGDKRIDALQIDIEDRAMQQLALRQPMAVDLRETLAAIKLAAELERIGDRAKNIAKRAIVLNREPPIRLTTSLARMGKQALAQRKQVLD